MRLLVSGYDAEDAAFLGLNAEIARRLNLTHMLHLDNPVGIWSYIRIANEITRSVTPCRLLDWGCGWGQMTYLLRRRGFAVIPFDFSEAQDTLLPDTPLCRGLDVVRSSDPVRLPFADAEFDAVLSCGVLEHVEESSPTGSLAGSLQEIRRVLRPGGRLLVFQLPRTLSWQENLQGLLRLGYRHPKRFTYSQIARSLDRAGFAVETVSNVNLMPKNLGGLPDRVRRAYGRLGRAVIQADCVLCSVPLLNHLAGSFEIVARATTCSCSGNAWRGTRRDCRPVPAAFRTMEPRAHNETLAWLHELRERFAHGGEELVPGLRQVREERSTEIGSQDRADGA